MVLYPIHANERDAFGLLKPHSTFTGGEGGLVVRLVAEGTDPKVNKIATSGAADTALHGLLDEQLTGVETTFGAFLAANSAPLPLGPATHLSSGRMSVWLNRGWFITDNYDIAVDGYGEAVSLAPGMLLNAKTSGTVGQLTDGAGVATRVYFMKMIEDSSDLLFSQVSPAPTTGMFAVKAPILVYQA